MTGESVALPVQVWPGFHPFACFEPGVIYLNRSSAGPQIVLNGGAVTVKATPLAVGSMPSIDSHRTPAKTGTCQRGSRVVVHSSRFGGVKKRHVELPRSVSY